MDAIRCAKCGGEMELGYVSDRNCGWHDPRKWFPGVLQLGWLEGIQKNKAKPLHVITYRCSACGYLESYAPKKQDKGVY